MSDQPQVVYERQPSNSLGLAGFIVSLVGWVSCGLLCPIGLVLSVIALRKQPRGFALAGVVLGVLGCFWAVVALFFGGIAFLIGCGGVVCGGVAPQVVTHVRIDQAVRDIEYFDRKYGRMPSDLDDLATHKWRGGRSRKDAWGHALHFELLPNGSFKVSSDGPDGVPGTGDDIEEIHTHGDRL